MFSNKSTGLPLRKNHAHSHHEHETPIATTKASNASLASSEEKVVTTLIENSTQ